MVQDEGRVPFLIAGEPHVHGGEVAGGKFLVGPRQNDALVLDDVQEVSSVVLVAQREGSALMGLDERVLSGEGHMGILVEQRVKNLGRRGRKLNDLIDVLGLEFHVIALSLIHI